MNTQLLERRTGHIPVQARAAAASLVMRFIETATTASNRATELSSRDEVNQSAAVVYDALFDLDRGIYAALLKLPGVLDHARQQGVMRLLSHKRNGSAATLYLQEETYVVQALVDLLPTQRKLKLFAEMAEKGVNNARTQKIILRTILGMENLPWVCIKYRGKIKAALNHAWGQRLTSIIQTILDTGRNDEKSAEIIVNNLLRYRMLYGRQVGLTDGTQLEAISFALGNKRFRGEPFTSDLLRSYLDAPTDYEALALLPPEIAENFRARYHKARSVADVMDKTKANVTAKQSVRVQKQAKALGVKVEVKAAQVELADLYVMAMAQESIDEATSNLIDERAKQEARRLSLPYQNVGVIADFSGSSYGSDEQRYRPAAIVSAVTAAIANCGNASVFSVGGRLRPDGICMPSGETDIARQLVDVLISFRYRNAEPEAIFVLSDGYENAPAGRFAEVVAAVRNMGNMVPIYQIAPAFSAESYGSKALSPQVPVIPVGNNIAALTTKLSERLIEADFIRGLAVLFEQAKITMQEGN